MPFDKKQKWSFGLGNFSQWYINSAFNLWVFTFYFSAVKLDINSIMLAYIIWTLWNAVNDPLIGFISDRINTRWGRRKPFIMIGTIPILILEIVLWLPPMDNTTVKFIYLLIMLICYDTFYSMISLPYDALFPELYTSVKERAEVNSIKQLLAIIGLVMAALIPGMFIDELDQPTGYLINGRVTSIIIATALIISLKYGVVERKEFKLDYKQQFNVIKGFKYTLKNKGFVLYTIMFFLYEYILLLLATIVPLFGEHVLGTTSTFETTIIMGIMYVIGALSVVLWRKLDLKLGSKKGYTLAIIAYFFSTLPMLFISDYMSGVITAIVIGFGFGGMLYFIYLLIADVIDEDELKTGVRREGTFFGITNFFMRLSMILSIVTIGIMFKQTKWDVYTPVPGLDVIFALRALFVIFPGVALGVTLICLYFYPFPKKKVEEIKVKIEELHKQKLDKINN